MSSFSESNIAPVKWAQRQEYVYLTISLADVKDEKIELTEKSLKFTGTCGSQNYSLDLEFVSATFPVFLPAFRRPPPCHCHFPNPCDAVPLYPYTPVSLYPCAYANISHPPTLPPSHPPTLPSIHTHTQFKSIETEGSISNVTPSSVVMKLMKADKEDEEWWPRLLADKIKEKTNVKVYT
jgi:hypothetical protein